ncbi:MAG: hypothetical protein IKZ61_11855 [Prevotella sp.]|nr:hypothetical protein [Prevotella sp.]
MKKHSKKISITINGVTYPCRQTMGAMLRFKQETGKEVTEMDGSFSDLCAYLWCCVKSACAADGIDFKLTLLDFADRVTPDDASDWADSVKEDSADADSEGRDTAEKKSKV